MRASTFLEGERVLEKLKRGWSSIPRSILKELTMDMLRRSALYTVNNLRQSEANLHFCRNAGRGQRYWFVQSKIITSTEAPNNILISILVDSDRRRSFTLTFRH